MNVSVIVATYGSEEWRKLGKGRAPSSAWTAGASEVVVRHEPYGTIASARNNAAAEATGPWLCFLDADDELVPGYVEAMRCALLRCPPATFRAYGGTSALLAPAVEFVYDGGGRRVGPAIPNLGGWPDVNECVIGTLVEKSVFERAGGFAEEWAVYEDYALWLACDRLGASIVHVPRAVYRAHVRLGGRNTGPSSTVKLTTYNEIRRRDKRERKVVFRG